MYPYIREFVIPFKQRVETNGGKFYLVVSATAWGSWQINNPEEYAEIYVGCLDRMRDKFNITPDYIIIYNEPGNKRNGAENNPEKVINALRSVLKRLKAGGYSVKVRWSATVSISKALKWIDSLREFGSDILPLVGQYDYHGYGGFENGKLNKLRKQAKKNGAATVMGEWWFAKDRDNADDIITSLCEADSVVYQATSDIGLINVGRWETEFHSGVKSSEYYTLRQFYRFIRPGDVRIQVTSSDNVFIKKNWHYNPKGHKIVAQELSNFLAEEVF